MGRGAILSKNWEGLGTRPPSKLGETGVQPCPSPQAETWPLLCCALAVVVLGWGVLVFPSLGGGEVVEHPSQ